jgi:hypothetical protein
LNQRTATLHFHPGGPPAPERSGPSASGSSGLPALGRSGPPATMPGATMPGGRTRESPTSRCEVPRRGSVAEPGEGCARLSTAPAATTPVARGGVDRATAAFTALVSERSRSPGFAVVAVLLAVALGAAHALAPGHGKTVMAAYLVGLRGTLGQAVTIGATVTITHTAGVLILGLVLSTTRAVASERVYPWLGLGSGLLLAAVGVGLLARARPGHGHAHPHGPGHPHGHGHPHLHGDGHPRPGPRWAGGGWWRSAWPVGWCRARRRWWCCSAGSLSGGPGSGSRWCWPTGSGWRPPSPGSGSSRRACGSGWTGVSTCRPGRS